MSCRDTQFQPTRPRETRPLYFSNNDTRRGVSTHASARDATFQDEQLRYSQSVSTHASARDATGVALRKFCRSGVSTHASARDATMC